MKRRIIYILTNTAMMFILSMMQSCNMKENVNGIEFYEVMKHEQFKDTTATNDDEEIAMLRDNQYRTFDVKINLKMLKSSNEISKEVCDRINRQLIRQVLHLPDNLSAEEAIERYIADMKKDFYDDSMIQTMYDYIDGAAEYNSKNIITYRVTEETFLGGAHPVTATTILTFNASNGDYIELENVFPAANHEALKELLTRRLMEYHNVTTKEALYDIGYYQMSEMFISPNFALRDDSIEFYYNQYDIAPYAMGPCSICISYDEAKPYMVIAEE